MNLLNHHITFTEAFQVLYLGVLTIGFIWHTIQDRKSSQAIRDIASILKEAKSSAEREDVLLNYVKKISDQLPPKEGE